MDGAADGALLAGGYRNEVRRLRQGRAWVIEKRYGAGDPVPNPMYPNLPDAEASALRLLAPLGLAPELLHHAPGTLTYRYVPGRTWRPGRRATLAAVAELLHAVHTVPVSDGFRPLCRSAGEARDHGDAMLAAVRDYGPAGMALRLRPERVATDPVHTASLVHTDCGPGNIVRSGGRLVLIDWQCPGLGDPVEDLACLLSPAMLVLYACRPLSPAAVGAFLDAYPDRDTVARYRRDADAWHFRIAGYCAWRAVHLADTDPEVAATYRTALAAELTRPRGAAT